MNPTRSLTRRVVASPSQPWTGLSGSTYLLASADPSVCPQQPLPVIREACSRRPGGPADWSQLTELSAREKGILNSSVMLTGGVGQGRSPRVKEQSCVGKAVPHESFGFGQSDPLSHMNDPRFP